jgi:prohibitin 2
MAQFSSSSDRNPIRNPARLFAFVIPVFVIAMLLLLTTCSSVHVVEPGHRGVVVTLGKVSEEPLPEGMNWITPLITDVQDVSVRQETEEMRAECYSSDLQQVNVTVKVLFRVPEKQVVKLFRDYAGDPFRNLVAPRVNEALKEIVAELSAEKLVKERQKVKLDTLERAKSKLIDSLELADIVIENIDLSDELERAIEAKMVQEQQAQKSRYAQEQAKIEAETSIIKAKAEAEAIKIQGEALRQNPDLVGYRIVEKWDGRAPLVISGGNGSGASNIILPIPMPDRSPAPQQTPAR